MDVVLKLLMRVSNISAEVKALIMSVYKKQWCGVRCKQSKRLSFLPLPILNCLILNCR